MSAHQPRFQDLLQEDVMNLHLEKDDTNNSMEVNEPVKVDVEIIEQTECVIVGENDELNESGEMIEEFNETEESNEVNDIELPVTDNLLNADCLMLCGRILRLMGDEITCKACGKHLQSMGDEIFSSYLIKNSISALFQDLSNREDERNLDHNMY